MSEDADPDELLMAELRGFFADVDPVPPLVSEITKASLGWRRLDAELAELLSDSALEEQAFALTRGGTEAPARAVTFSSGGLTIDIEVHADDEDRMLLGQLSPPAPATIEIQRMAEAPLSTEADRLGRFRVRLPSGGGIRLRIVGAGGSASAPVETSWITV